jgi:hypothetical protein
MQRDDDDDPQLKSLRAVWLDMRDEEPPERGLAELMAAARVKATEMQEPEQPDSRVKAAEVRDPEPRPTLWQRFAALLRRPPVLALATATVLLGGVVMIGTRGEQMHAEAPSLRAEHSTAVDPSTPTANRAEAGGEARAVEPAAIAAPADEPIHVEENRPDSERRGVAPAAEPADARPASAPGRTKSTRRAAPPTARDTDRVTETLDDATMYRREHARAFESTVGPDGIEAPSAGGSARGPATGKPTGTTPGTRGAATDTRDATRASRAGQFLAEAKAAATRGDCARAQAWLKRLAAEDATAYRKALETDARLRACLAE